MEAMFEQCSINIDFDNDEEKLSIHVPKRVEPPREEILKSILSYNHRDDELLLS